MEDFMTRFTTLALLTLGALSACDTSKEPIDPDDLPDNAPKGTLVVELSGGSEGEVNSSVEEVWIRFEDVQVKHEDEGWISIAEERADLDLMTLRDGITEELGRAEVLEGAYESLRLMIADAWIVVDGTEQDLTIAEGFPLPEAGLTFDESFFVDEGSTTTLLLDWDLSTQLTDDEGEWMLGTDAIIDVSLGEEEEEQ
jgi:hypothetical protein